MDDAIRYFRGEFTKGKATIFIDYILDLSGPEILTSDNSRYINNIYKFIQRILLLTSSIRNTLTVYDTIMAKKAKKLTGPHGTV